MGVWLLWILSWFVAARVFGGATEKRASLGTELRYRVFVLGGFALLGIPAHGYEGRLRLWSVDRPVALACLAATVAGFAFCWWARIHLGKLWSATITKREGHHVVDTGPYGIVRHPIYTGVLTAAYATTIVKGTILGFAGAASFTFGFYLKARFEELWLSRELGEAAYGEYRKRVPMLIPFFPR